MSRGMLRVLETMLPYGSLYWGTLTAFCLPLRRRENFKVRLALSLLPLLLLPESLNQDLQLLLIWK